MKKLAMLLLTMFTQELAAEIPVGKWFGMNDGRAFYLLIEGDGSTKLIVSGMRSPPIIHRSQEGSVEERNSTYQIVYDSPQHMARTILSFSAWRAPDNPCCKISGFIHSASTQKTTGDNPREIGIVGGHEILLNELEQDISEYVFEYAETIRNVSNNSIQSSADAPTD